MARWDPVVARVQTACVRRRFHPSPRMHSDNEASGPRKFRTRTAVEGPSDRSFGLTFSAVFTIVALWPLPWGGEVRAWALALAAAVLALALFRPSVLAPLNALWLKFGLLLHKFTTPLMLGVIFFLVILPLGFLMRLAGKRPLQLRFERHAPTYWIDRNPGEQPGSMRNQF